MKFTFKAKSQEGQIKEGEVEAASREGAIQILQNYGLVPFLVREGIKIPEVLRDIKKIWEGSTQRELAAFFRELSILMDAKVPIVASLRAIEAQVENKYLEMVIKEIANDIEDGSPLSEAMAKHPGTFSNLIVNMVKSGEVSGNLNRSVLFLADNIEKKYILTSRIRGALLYPAVVLGMTGLVGFLAVTIILPRLSEVIRSLGIDLPWYTRFIMAVGDFFNAYWWAILLVILSAIFAFIYYIKSETGKKEWDQVKINLPIVGKIFRYVYLGRFADNLSLMLVGGIPIVRALLIVSEVVDNSVYQAVILRSADEVKAGGNIYTVFSKSAFVPPIVSRMIRIGEETGKTGDVLKNISNFYDQEVDRITGSLMTLIEPVMIVILGAGVAVLVFAILLPIYDIAAKI
jgi:type II secretory pathway component PulF